MVSKVRGNWQKRVENAQSRRKETKQRKQRKENKSIYKSHVQTQLWPLLDTYECENGPMLQEEGGRDKKGNDVRRRKDLLHIWLDSMPQSLKEDERGDLELNDDDNDDGETSGKQKKKMKKRDSERVVEDDISFQSPKSRKNGKKSSGSASKKPHPRSHAAAESEMESDKPQYFCREDFFTGACSVKKSPYHRMNAKVGQWTLAAMLLKKEAKGDKSTKSRAVAGSSIPVHNVLEKSLEAYVKSFEELESDGEDEKIEVNTIGPMDPIYYIAIDLSSLLTSTDDEELKEEKQVSDLVHKYFVSQKTAIGSIVYAVYDQSLIFDRYQGGVLLDTEERENFFERDKSNVGLTDSSPRIANQLNAITLQQILSFLPNEAAGVLSLVSKSWHLEIGVSSPALWKDLLDRNNWPLMREEDTRKDVTSAKDYHRALFLSHYELIRNIDCMNQGGLSERSNVFNDNTYGAMLKFNSGENRRKGTCRLYAWDERSVIVANKYECTLSIYETKEGEHGPKCRKSVEVRVAPFPTSKKTLCELHFMTLDECMVACVFEVNGLANHITAISRDDLLSTSGNSFTQYDELGTELKVFDMNEKIAEYCETHMEAEFLTGDLLFYLQGGGDFKHLGLSINDLCACGMGRFMLKAWICIPGDDNWIETTRVVILFSIPHSSILSVDVLAESLGNRQADIVLTSYVPRSRRLPTKVICTSNDSPEIILFEVDLKQDTLVTSTIRDELLISRMFMGDLATSSSPRLSLVTENEIILADLISSVDEDGEIEQSKITLSFLSLQSDSSYDKSVTTLDLEGDRKNLQRTDISELRVRSIHGSGDHVILLYTFVFRGSMISSEQTGLIAVHIPSKKETHAWVLPEFFEETTEFMICKQKDEIILSFISDHGIFITSRSIRRGTIVAEDDEENEAKVIKKSKKKKQKGMAKGRKKDGFARGMSVRG